MTGHLLAMGSGMSAMAPSDKGQAGWRAPGWGLSFTCLDCRVLVG